MPRRRPDQTVESEGPPARRDAAARRAGLLLVLLLGGLAAGYWTLGARHRVLNGAVVTTQATFAAPMAVARSDTVLQAMVSRFMSTKGRGLAYLTLRGTQGQVLASDGVWPLHFHGMLSPATARAWRAWIYRTLCAERVSMLKDANGRAVGRMRLGIAWWRVFGAAGPLAWLASGLSLIGLIGLLREMLGRRRKSAAGSRRGTSGPKPPGGRRDRSRASPFRGVLGAKTVADEFAPIEGPDGTHATRAAAPNSARRPAARSRPTETAVAGQRDDDASTLRRTASVADGPQTGALTRPDLRLLPVWSGVRGGLLAGGLVRLECAEDGDTRSLTISDWAAAVADRLAPGEAMKILGRRLTALQDHWRGLEYFVPRLIVPVPDAWSGDAALSELWPRLTAQWGTAGCSLVLCAPERPASIDDAPGLRWAACNASPGGRDRLRLVFSDNARDHPGQVEDLILSDSAPLPPGVFARLGLTHDWSTGSVPA